MGWFESQIKERQSADQTRMESALLELTNAVTGGHAISDEDAQRQANDAIAGCLGFYGFKIREAPRGMKDIQKLMDFHVRPTGVMYRKVTLPADWYRDAIGPLLGFTSEGTPVALLPSHRGYFYYDTSTGRKVHLSATSAQHLKDEAFCFYRPLPNRSLTTRDLMKFVFSTFSNRDYGILIAATLAVSLLGLILPIFNQIIFGPVVTGDDINILVPVLVVLIGVQFSQILIEALATLVRFALESKLTVTLEASIMMRVLMLPATFFKTYSAGALALRIQVVKLVASTLVNSVFKTVLSAAFDLIYLVQIFFISPPLCLPASLTMLAVLAVLALTMYHQVRIMRTQLECESDLNGWQYALIGGLQKVKLAGAEKRGFATWAERYASLARATYTGPLVWRASSAITTLVVLVGTVAIYFFAMANAVPVNDYMAFSSAFGMVSGSFLLLSETIMDIAAMKPQLEIAQPILEAVPEMGETRPVVTSVSGSIEIENITFSYNAGQPPILEDFSLKVRRGQYVAIVGKSGCGKSTLMRLLLGFEKPNRGAVYFDGRDLSSIDVASLRRQIGVVLQDGKLFSGDIYSNITVSAPWLTMDEAWEAAEAAGIADDIRAMPMGMFTMISEGGGGISGGQRQRLMIARAIASKPKILMFDEATSALDNISQKVVSDSLDRLKCTRIIVAHRLSTIRTCDRIVLIENGHIAEDGTYDELIDKHGAFYELVKRQQIDE